MVINVNKFYSIDEIYAIKVITQRLFNADRKAIIQEALMYYSFGLPRVPKLKAVAADCDIYFVMDMVKEGKPLNEKCVGLPLKEKIAFIIQLCDIVEVIHDKNIIHRDLKPSNILVNENNEVYLIDFGTCKKCTNTTSLTADTKGTDYYFPVENCEIIDEDTNQEVDEDGEYIESEKNNVVKPFQVSIAFDIWSIACIISQIATDKDVVPWSNFDIDTVPWKSMGHKKKPKLSIMFQDLLLKKYSFPFPDGINEKLKQILEKCLVHEPKERISISELRDQLNEFINSL